MNNRKFFLSILESGKFKIKALGDLVSSKDFLVHK